MPSGEGGSKKAEAEGSDADFETAYSADSEGEANAPSEDAKKVDVPDSPPKAPKLLSDAAAAEGEADVRIVDVDAEADVTKAPLPGSDLASQTEEAPGDLPVQKTRGSDTSELAFAQRVRVEQGAAPQEAPTGKVQITEAQKGPTDVATEGAVAKPAAVAVAATDKATTTPQTLLQAAAQTAAMPTEKPAPDPAKAALMPAGKPLPDVANANAPKDRARREDESRLTMAREAPSNANQGPKTTVPTPPVNPSAQQNVALTAQTEKPAVDLQLAPVGDLDAPSSWDPRGPAPTTLAQTLARPETPGMIGRQMVEILQRFPDRPVELSLNPEELGRVRLSISAAESGITVHVLAERPETLDLMRRHIDQLAREFQALGYDSINFAFNEGQSEQGTTDHGENGGQPSAGDLLSGVEADAPIPVTMTASTGVDIRV